MENKEEIPISLNTMFGVGGTGRHEGTVDYETAMFMMQADVIDFDNRLYRVKHRVVNNSGFLDFYCDEISKEDLNY